MTRNLSPRAIERLAMRRFIDRTGRTWTKATAKERRQWLAAEEPVIRAEHGIALDAVWHGGDWQAPGQADLFPLPDDAAEVA
ncbi:hypothetical protein [Amycolatopsis sp. MtRt-6]|uniref:hypothetical protein n=1 Tax=Amycolatopsis sp. MtRt-6 TaxID=2792782 RepID=UPI0027DE055E|nr:hypothetical protein [Amycolatopsis sp. MtRt-6]